MNNKLFMSLCVAPVAAMAFQVGAWVGGPGQYPQPTKENVQAFQELQGSKLDPRIYTFLLLNFKRSPFSRREFKSERFRIRDIQFNRRTSCPKGLCLMKNDIVVVLGTTAKE